MKGNRAISQIATSEMLVVHNQAAKKEVYCPEGHEFRKCSADYACHSRGNIFQNRASGVEIGVILN